jgi:hypothetical protein
MKNINLTRSNTLPSLFVGGFFGLCRVRHMRNYAALFFILVIGFTSAVYGVDEGHDQKWQDVRDHQPAGLHLKLTLPRDHFFQGERINATLEFSNDDAKHPWSVAVGAGTPGARFRATDEKGAPIIDPLKWRNDWYPMVITGPVGIHALGHYTLTLPINESVRFDAPGVYSLYALASVTEGVGFDGKNRADLVSDQGKVTIDPLTPEQEKATLTEARQKISVSKKPLSGSDLDGVAELRYLQTRAARDELIKLLGNHDLSGWVTYGLLGAPDPEAEASRIVEQVRAGKLVLDDTGAELYGELKTYPLIRGLSPVGMPEKEAQARMDELWKARKAAQKEVLDAAIAATDNQGSAKIEALWSAFEEQAIHKNPGEPDGDGGHARAAIAAHQLELSADHVKRLLDAWEYWGSADFLPLVRREAAPPHNNLIALIALAGLRPDEARPRIIEDFKKSEPRFFERSYPSSTLLCVIPPMPLPQFDSLFRAKLEEEKGDAFPIIPVIGCFGSPALLPDVVKAYNQYGQDVVEGSSRTEHWDSAIKQCLFRYWLRSDPKGGAAALEQAIISRGKDGAGLLSSVLQYPWMNEGFPVVKWALDNSDAGLVGEGVYFTEQHGDESSIDTVISALERMRDNAAYPDFSSREAAYLLKSTHWHYSDPQRKRLDALASASRTK